MARSGRGLISSLRTLVSSETSERLVKRIARLFPAAGIADLLQRREERGIVDTELVHEGTIGLKHERRSQGSGRVGRRHRERGNFPDCSFDILDLGHMAAPQLDRLGQRAGSAGAGGESGLDKLHGLFR